MSQQPTWLLLATLGAPIFARLGQKLLIEVNISSILDFILQNKPNSCKVYQLVFVTSLAARQLADLHGSAGLVNRIARQKGLCCR